jgi:hypothetical protein
MGGAQSNVDAHINGYIAPSQVIVQLVSQSLVINPKKRLLRVTQIRKSKDCTWSIAGAHFHDMRAT